MNDILDSAKSLGTVFAGLLLAVGVAVGALALVLNLLKLMVQ